MEDGGVCSYFAGGVVDDLGEVYVAKDADDVGATTCSIAVDFLVLLLGEGCIEGGNGGFPVVEVLAKFEVGGELGEVLFLVHEGEELG